MQKIANAKDTSPVFITHENQWQIEKYTDSFDSNSDQLKFYQSTINANHHEIHLSNEPPIPSINSLNWQ